MTTTVVQSGVTFVLSGAREAQLAGFVSQLAGNAGWQAQLGVMVAAGRTTVVVSDNPIDLPQSIRASAYADVYSNAASSTGEVGGVTKEPAGSNTAFILMNNSAGTRPSPVVPGQIDTRDPFVIFVHEVFHVGRTGTANHPYQWAQQVTAVVRSFGFTGAANSGAAPTAPDVSYLGANPTPDFITNQTPGIPTGNIVPGNGTTTTRDDGTSTITDGLGNVVHADTRNPDGGYNLLDNDHMNTQPWTSRTSIATAAGVITSTSFAVGAGDTGAIVGTAGITNTINASISYTAGTNINNLTLTGAAAINGTGNALANVITGNAAANSLFGLDGNDTLNGNDGDDTLYGGNGNDIVLGGAGNDTLIGGAGADSLQGGTGNDIFYVDALDTISENANEGNDTVYADFTYTLGANLENIVLIGTANITATGSSAANILLGKTRATTRSSASVATIRSTAVRVRTVSRAARATTRTSSMRSTRLSKTRTRAPIRSTPISPTRSAPTSKT